MAAYINPALWNSTNTNTLLDATLASLKAACTHLHIIKTAQPTTWAEATGANDLGYKAAPTISDPGAGTGGRKVTISAITDGVVDASGTAAYYALTDDTNQVLLATYELNATHEVVSGNTFSLTAIDLTLLSPAA